MAIRVDCVNKTDRYDPHDRIRTIGGRSDDGTRWSLSQEDAIAGVESRRWDFYVSVNGHAVAVIVANRLGHKYLKTVADGEQPNNLLSFPECP